jgi:hypothetical protein
LTRVFSLSHLHIDYLSTLQSILHLIDCVSVNVTHDVLSMTVNRRLQTAVHHLILREWGSATQHWGVRLSSGVSDHAVLCCLRCDVVLCHTYFKSCQVISCHALSSVIHHTCIMFEDDYFLSFEDVHLRFPVLLID